MSLFLLSIGLFVAGGFASLVTSRRAATSLLLGTAGAALGSLLGLVAALRALAAGPPPVLAAPWSEPLAALRLGLDPLSAFFLVALFALGLPAALFGHGYMRRTAAGRPLGPFLFFFNLLLAAIALVLAARQAVAFLVAWELMAVASFFLVVFDHEDPEVRRAGLTYLVASHLGTAFLFALFLLLGREAGSFDFEALQALPGRAGLPAALLFGLALVGFGTKAGLVPLHVWLPEAHPAAPSHVSALLSGAMIKVGVYGLLRTLTFLPPAPLSWGVGLAALGALGAFVAIVLALGQTDVKRALAYSSVENMGIVLLGIGLGLAAAAQGSRLGSALAFAGALLHVWNHAMMKGLAFLGAGALAHAAHTRDLEKMGGLLGRLPRTGGLFLVSAVALSALPPLNGFVSEWLLYLGLLEAVRAPRVETPLAATLGLAGLALVGAVAAAAFTRLAGLALLGAPRSPGAARAEEPGLESWGPLGLLALGCAGLALFPAEALSLAAPAIAAAARQPVDGLRALLAAPAGSLALPVRAVALGLGASAAFLWLWRARALARRQVGAAETWGCGFTGPTARMQYTGSSYAQFLLSGLVPRLLAPRIRVVMPQGLLPPRASLRSVREDPARRRLFDPLFQSAATRFQALRRLQTGRLHLQLLYTVVTLVVLTLYLVLRHP